MQHIATDPGGALPIAGLYALPTSTPPMPAVARILSRFTRPRLEGFIAVAIDLLDTMDGDPDVEDATNAEDEGITWAAQLCEGREYAGCPISDPGGGNVDDGLEHDPADEGEHEDC